jgi:hypothetical protein
VLGRAFALALCVAAAACLPAAQGPTSRPSTRIVTPGPTTTPVFVSSTDCGTTEETPLGYSASARECVWTAYLAGKAAYWNIYGATIEGDPIVARLSFDPARGFEITRDFNVEAAPSDRRVWSYHCTTMTKQFWYGDTSQPNYYFEFTGCTGDDGPTNAFP